MPAIGIVNFGHAGISYKRRGDHEGEEGGYAVSFTRAIGGFFALIAILLSSQAFAAQQPNILVLWGDDIGYWNVSAYNQGMMGYKTPNIDRIAKEGALFTDWYGQQSCTAGRAAFITGQVGFRTGLLKVGLPGAKEGLAGARRHDRPAAERRRDT